MMKVVADSLIARVACWKLGVNRVAIVIGDVVYLYGVSAASFLADSRWVKHEECHLAQFKQYGFVRFVFMYLWEWLRHGYYNNKYEVEARKAEGL